MKRILKKLLAKLNIRVINLRYSLKPFVEERGVLNMNFDHVIANYILNVKNGHQLNFIQIGAFDGIMRDPIRKFISKYAWEGIMVEPQPVPFGKLRILYANNARIKLVNCVISDSAEKKTLYVVEESKKSLPDWIHGSASFNRDNLAKYKDVFPGIESNIKQILVDSITMDDLLKLNGNKFIDLLQIDAEGYDGELIQMFPFDKTKPNIIHFESKNLDKASLESILNKLIGLDYECAFDGGKNNAEDIIAVLKDPAINRIEKENSIV